MALLVSACGFTEPRKFILIKETHDIDGSFLISSLIGQRLRQQSAGIVLVCCQQTLKYYDTCGKKLGYNLTMSTSKKCIQVIEPLRTMTDLEPDALMETLLSEVHDKVTALETDGKKNIAIIIDDLAFFTNLGCSERSLIKAGLRLHELTQTNVVTSVALKIGLSDFHSNLTNNLEDVADVILTLEGLRSGNFRDVDGKLIIKKVNSGNEAEPESERNLLYFVGDHNVKLTAPGEFGLKV